jgi:hypothetical protein
VRRNIIMTALVTAGMVLGAATAANACNPTLTVDDTCSSLTISAQDWERPAGEYTATVFIDGEVAASETFTVELTAWTVPLSAAWADHEWLVEITGPGGRLRVDESGSTTGAECVPGRPATIVDDTSEATDDLWTCGATSIGTSRTVTTTVWVFNDVTGAWELGVPDVKTVLDSRIITPDDAAGCVGPQGPAGETGTQGDDGLPGATGARGPAGVTTTMFVPDGAAAPVVASPVFTG